MRETMVSECNAAEAPHTLQTLLKRVTLMQYVANQALKSRIITFMHLWTKQPNNQILGVIGLVDPSACNQTCPKA
jgi:hypothetical protein